ncbi:PREDICTED: protein NUCLEAR FUSION DEFECTIVE 5, mitochondrial [Tarenaya hassleriana]|uniref:protein NUCLEAR FUSION DEFECTIVE 5, mitochondrial n=1 Tax=Tarenaya hassleriana TaxID=28532 RepID=UPI00053C1DA6|nr:PREDICTED: protein NUCLEAR FUSION DEFECTIVE 5, mitochondrial [Tarenaya hassleriana]
MKSFLVSRQAVNRFSTLSSRSPNFCRNFSAITASISNSDRHLSSHEELNLLKYPKSPIPISSLNRYFHCTRETRLSESSVAVSDDQEEDGDDDNGSTNEFLSRFVWIMRRKVSEAYPDCDKTTVDGMLLLIVQKVVEEIERGGIGQVCSSAPSPSPSADFSDDLWNTVWEVSNTVLKDMEKEREKEKMKQYIQDPEVMEMCRFAGEIGIRGDMLRELRFKWAREKMEDSDFYESLELQREEARARESVETEFGEEGTICPDEEEQPQVLSLPKRKGKFRYKIYGLDLSDPKWVEVADKIHEAEEIEWTEPKPVTGKCKMVMEKLLSLKEEDDPSALMAEWAELLQPHRVDWTALLDRLREQNTGLYLKVAELVLDDKSFQAGIRDYSKLIDAHAQANRIEDAERILKKMNQNGIFSDIATATTLVRMYSKSGNLDRAKEEFDSLKSLGFRPDMKIYNSMIMAYVNANKPDLAESLLREMDAKDVKPSEEIYMVVLRSFAQLGNASAASRISTSMQIDGIQLNYETFSLVIEAWGREGDADQARSNFDYMRKLGHKPDDRCISYLIQAYKKRNSLDKALNLLLQLEKAELEIGVFTYTVLVDWMARLGLNDEVEQLLVKISQLGEAPPVGLQASLCYMYSRAKNEKKTLQTLGVLEAKKDQLEQNDFETVVTGLKSGGFEKDARRMFDLMKALGFAPSERLKMDMAAPTGFVSRAARMR